eukprot:7561545-Alexandrium_andersonii.AAC.1
MCFLRYTSTDSAAAAVYALHGHFLGDMVLEVEVCQYDIRAGMPRGSASTCPSWRGTTRSTGKA